MEHSPHQRIQKVISAAETGIRSVRELDPELWSDLERRLSQRKGKLILTGVGKSGYVAMKIAATLTSLGHPATFVHPIEALHGDSGVVGNGDVVLAFSYSGNTKELLLFLRHVVKHFTVDIIGITGGLESALAQLAQLVVPVKIEEEGCPLNLAPMASTTTMLVLGDAIAALLTSPLQFTKSDFARFHPSGTLGLELTPVAERMLYTDTLSVHENMPLREALGRMNTVGKGIVAVVSDTGELLGSITDGDVRRFFSRTESSVGAVARDAMSADPKSIQQSRNLKEALVQMELHKITNLFVLDDQNALIGIIHIHDIVEV